MRDLQMKHTKFNIDLGVYHQFRLAHLEVSLNIRPKVIWLVHGEARAAAHTHAHTHTGITHACTDALVCASVISRLE